jgi:hypothetical protein
LRQAISLGTKRPPTAAVRAVGGRSASPAAAKRPEAPGTAPQVWGLRPWLAAFLRRAFFLRRRFDDMPSPLQRTFPSGGRPGGHRARASARTRGYQDIIHARSDPAGGPDPAPAATPARRPPAPACGRTPRAARPVHAPGAAPRRASGRTPSAATTPHRRSTRRDEDADNRWSCASCPRRHAADAAAGDDEVRPYLTQAFRDPLLRPREGAAPGAPRTTPHRARALHGRAPRRVPRRRHPRGCGPGSRS